MIWWLRARRADVLLPLGTAGMLALALLFQDTVAALPSLTLPGSNQLALTTFAPVPLVGAVALCLDSRLDAAEMSGTRPVPLLDVGLIAVAMAAAVALSCVLGAALGSPALWTAGRNAAFLTGLLLCARPLVGRPAVMVPVAWLVAVVFLGFRAPYDPHVWAIVPETIGTPHAALVTAGVFLSGAFVHLLIRRSAL